MKSKVIFCLFVMGLSSVAMADGAPVNAYTFRVETPSLQITCADHAQKLAADFAQATQLGAVTGACTGTRTLQEGANQFGIDTIVVSYSATSEVRPVQANYGGYEFQGTPDLAAGLFDTYAACYAEMAKQEALFTANTGLAAVASHCDLPTDSLSKGYVLVIEGFGKTKAGLFEYTQQGPDAGSLRDAPEFQTAQNVIVASGGQVAYTDATHIFYYAPYAVSVFTTYMAIFPNASECQSQIANAQQALAVGQYDGLSVFCGEMYGDTALTAMGSGVDMINPQTSTDRYASFTDCMGDKARVEANAASDGAQVTAAICRPEDGTSKQYVVDLYFARN